MISKSQAVRKEGSAVNPSGLLQPDWRRDCAGSTTPKQGKGERKWKWTTPLRDSEAKSPLSHRKKLENDVQHCLCVTWKYWYGRVGVACPQACESETDPCDAPAFHKALVHTREAWSRHQTKIQLHPSTRWAVKHKALAFWGHLANNCYGHKDNFFPSHPGQTWNKAMRTWEWQKQDHSLLRPLPDYRNKTMSLPQ